MFQKSWKLRNKGIFQKTRNSQTGNFRTFLKKHVLELLELLKNPAL